jgi:1-phosphofructokinase family hexose kinase
MIVTVTLNPSLDRTLSVPQLIPGALHRARLLRVDLGGKGINVSRALQILGLPSRIVGFAGGQTGRTLQVGLQAQAFAVSFIEVPGEIRQNITLLDESTGQYTKINEPGPAIGSQHVAALEELLERTVQSGDLWAFCGSLPPGAPPDLYARLITRVHAKGALAFLDASHAPLRAGLRAGPYALKINSEEAGELLGRPLESAQALLLAARQLQTHGTRLVMITHAAQGLILATPTGVVFAAPPTVTTLSPVGAGDATLAGLLWAVTDRSDLAATSRRAAACGAAAAMQSGTALGDLPLIQSLLPKITITTP